MTWLNPNFCFGDLEGQKMGQKIYPNLSTKKRKRCENWTNALLCSLNNKKNMTVGGDGVVDSLRFP